MIALWCALASLVFTVGLITVSVGRRICELQKAETETWRRLTDLQKALIEQQKALAFTLECIKKLQGIVELWGRR